MRSTQPSAAEKAAAVDRLREAATSRVPCPPIRDLVDACDITTAYEIQSRLVAERVAAGSRVVGRKIGLTSPAVQAQLGVDRPDFGVLLDDMACDPAVPLAVEGLLQPKIEAEIAFVLARDLDATGPVTAKGVLAATDHLRPALEIVDSRIAGWDISIADTVADNASSGLFVLGDSRIDPAGVDLATVTMTLHRGDDAVSAGTGADCLGNPLIAVAWLATTARDFGAPLRAGDIVLSGALGPMTPVTGGDVFTAEISGIGSVTARFSQGGSA